MVEPTKVCSKCKEEKSLNDFSIHSGKYLKTFCKVCHSNHVKDYYKKNKTIINSKTAEKNKIKYHRNPLFRLKDNLRSRLRKALKNNCKSGSSIKDLGCSIEEFKKYLESKFQEGMSWENRRDWHIDHIKPLSFFDLSNREQFLEACHYTNLQPLWAKDNLIKGSKHE